MVYSFNNFPFFDGEGAAQEVPRPERLPGYTARDWADAVLDELGKVLSDDPRGIRKAEWDTGTPQQQTSYLLTRHEQFRSPKVMPAQIYRLTVQASGSSDFIGYYLDSADSYARKCIDDWSKAIRPTKLADKEMRRHLATAGVDPTASILTPRNIRGVLKELETAEYGTWSRARRAIGRMLLRKHE